MADSPDDPEHRLAADAAGELRAARTYAEIANSVIELAISRGDVRLRTVSPGELAELTRSTAALEAAVMRVLGRLAPDVARSAPAIADLSRRLQGDV